MTLADNPTGTLILLGFVSALSLHAYSTFGHVRGYRPLISPTSTFSALLPRIRSLNPGITWQWDERRTAYFNHSHDVISIIPILLGKPYFFTCSVDVLRQVLGNDIKNHLTKPLDLTLDSLWGASVASASGEIWRRHRRIVGPAFNANTYELVRETVAYLYQEMIEQEGWSEQQRVTIPSLNKYMIKLSLLTLARCAFGMSVSWTSSTGKTEEMNLIEAITLSSETIIAKLLLPTWVLKLPFKPLRKVDSAWNALEDFVKSHTRRIGQEMNEQGNNDQFEVRNADLLHRLIACSEGDGRDGKYQLSEKEVLANIFTILFAGHETTANGIIATLGYLAIHQDEQEKAYVEVKNRFGPNDQLGLPDTGEMPYLLACFHEAIVRVTNRFLASTLMLARTLSKDFPVKVERPSPGVVVLPKGSRIVIDTVNTFRNPYIFKDPEQYKPSRWLGIPETEVTMFGTGPRACIGRKLAATEAISVLAFFLRDWALDIDLAPGETRSQYEERVMVIGPYGGTISPIAQLPLKITKRVRA
ncbi:hypothetical protein C0995_011343 [Termitomyces sp. Mi166|nr:hypothetical protein C0995_011343 [Termitomyces sp. Mi166\